MYTYLACCLQKCKKQYQAENSTPHSLKIGYLLLKFYDYQVSISCLYIYYVTVNTLNLYYIFYIQIQQKNNYYTSNTLEHHIRFGIFRKEALCQLLIFTSLFG